MRTFTVTTATPIVITGDEDTSVGYPTKLPYPMTIATIPGGGGTLAVEFQVVKGSANWFAWTPGVVSAATVDLLAGPVYAVRFTAATADGVIEVNQ